MRKPPPAPKRGGRAQRSPRAQPSCTASTTSVVAATPARPASSRRSCCGHCWSRSASPEASPPTPAHPPAPGRPVRLPPPKASRRGPDPPGTGRQRTHHARASAMRMRLRWLHARWRGIRHVASQRPIGRAPWASTPCPAAAPPSPTSPPAACGRPRRPTAPCPRHRRPLGVLLKPEGTGPAAPPNSPGNAFTTPDECPPPPTTQHHSA